MRRVCLGLVGMLCAVGCGGLSYNGQDTGDYENQNSGRARILSLALPPKLDAMVGVPMSVRVSRAADGAQWCRGVNHQQKDPTTGLPSGSIASEQCAPVAPTPDVVEILSVSCSDDVCDARPDGASVVLTGRAPKRTVVTVTARMSSGPNLTDAFGLEFRQPHSFEVRCSRTSPCPGRDAIFTGAKLHWYLRLNDPEGRAIDARFQVAAEPADMLTVAPLRAFPGYHLDDFYIRGGFDEYSFTANRPGTVTLTATAGTATWTHTIRVAAVSEAVSGAVHHLAIDPNVQLDFSSDRGPRPSGTFSRIGEPAGDVGLGHRLVFAWTLADGTRAIATQRQSKAIASNVAPDWFGLDIEGRDLDYFELAEYPCRPKTVALSGVLGSAPLMWPVTLTCKQ